MPRGFEERKGERRREEVSERERERKKKNNRERALRRERAALKEGCLSQPPEASPVRPVPCSRVERTRSRGHSGGHASVERESCGEKEREIPRLSTSSSQRGGPPLPRRLRPSSLSSPFNTRSRLPASPALTLLSSAEGLELEMFCAPRSTSGRTGGRQGSSRRVGADRERRSNGNSIHRGGERPERGRDESIEACLFSLAHHWDLRGAIPLT